MYEDRISELRREISEDVDSRLYGNTNTNIPESVTLGSAHVALAVLCLAESINRVAIELRGLGLNGASTPMGAIETLGLSMKEGLGSVAEAISEVSMEYKK